MPARESSSTKSSESTTRTLQPMWSPLFNLGLAASVGLIAALIAFSSTNDLRDGGTLIAIPICFLVWFMGDILRWRGRYPMRLFLMVPIFVAVGCAVSIRFFQKANQRRIAWNSIIEAGASVNFETLKIGNWVQYDEGIFLPGFLEEWFGKAMLANSAQVSIPMVSFAIDSPEVRRLRSLDLGRIPKFYLDLSDRSRSNLPIDLEVFSQIVNSNQVELLEVNLNAPTEEAIKSLKAIKRPYYLRFSGVLTEKAMRHFPAEGPVQFIVLSLSDPPNQTSWLNFLPSSSSCDIVMNGNVTPANLQTMDVDRPFNKLRFEWNSLSDSAILELVRLNKTEFIQLQGVFWSQPAIDAIFKSPASLDIGLMNLTADNVQTLMENKVRTRLDLSLLGIESGCFQRLASVKSLKKIHIGFELSEQDIQSIALFPADIEMTWSNGNNKSQAHQIDEAIKNRK